MSVSNHPSPEKIAAQEKLQRDIEAFLSSGGIIEQVPIQERSGLADVDDDFIEAQRRRGAKAHRAPRRTEVKNETDG